MRNTFIMVLIAIFAPPLTATEYRPGKGEVQDLTGTSWEMTDSAGERIVWNLEPNGVLSYKSNSGFWRNGSWRQNGSELYLETNNKYYEATGVVSGDCIENGRCWNVAGLKNTWTGRQTATATEGQQKQLPLKK